MGNVKLKLILCIIWMYLVEVSSSLFNLRIFDLAAGKFSEERSELRRNVTLSRSINYDGPILDFIGLVNQFGYEGEEHRVTTTDGYRLKIHRIPGSKGRPKTDGKPVAFFQHGLFASSDSWVLLGPEKDLAYELVDAGYDVWLGNARGNTYSRSHVRLSPDYDPDFWRFSFHEIALYDVSATIDCILKVTGQGSILYIGHSMGTTISYALLSMKPEYNDKIWLVISMAPVAFWRHEPRPLMRLLKNNAGFLKRLAHNTRIYEMFPLTAASQKIARTACGEASVFRQLCLNFWYLTSGYNPDQLNATLLPYFMTYFPAGTSVQTLLHFGQNLETRDFRMFDHGTTRNLQLYGQLKPPSYYLKNVVAPVALFYGKGDAIVTKEDPIELARELPNVVALESIADENFSHLDFLFSKDVKKLINDRIFRITTDVVKRINYV